ncbi:MAG: hypothetical protein QNK22_04150 [Xanthomonadales bacterium]|nr:hypothetical protein [Xanthomonadales bacterium]
MILLVLLMPVTAFAISLNEAAEQAARQNDAKVLSARTVENGNSRVHEIKLLTRDGVVKTVRVRDNSKTGEERGKEEYWEKREERKKGKKGKKG